MDTVDGRTHVQLQGSLVRDISRASVGRVREVLLDPDTLDARWLLVDADGTTVLVPAAAATEFVPGELLVPYDNDTIVSATHPDGRAVSETDAARLLRHYGFAVQEPPAR